MRFLDTNVIIYAVDTEDRAKAAKARSILEATDLALSVQVLQEFYVQATRPGRPDPLSHEQAANMVEAMNRFPVADVTFQILRGAMKTRERFRISYWDAAILEAAKSLGCEVVLSEDLNHGQDYGGVRVENPFRSE